MDGQWVLIGDVIKDLDFPNLMDLEARVASAKNSNTYLTYPKSSKSHFVFLSHECSFNEGKVKSFLFAPLENIPAGIDKDAFLAANNVALNPNFFNLFCYDIIPGVTDKRMCIDFNKMLHMPSKLKDNILANKVFQLPNVDMKLLKYKLSFYFLHENPEFTA